MLRVLFSFLFFLVLTANVVSQHRVKFVDEADREIGYVQVVTEDQIYVAEENGILDMRYIPDSVRIMRLGFMTEKTTGKQLFNHDTYRLTTDVLMDEVVVIGRGEETVKDYYTQVAIINHKKINRLQPQSTVDALSRTGTAYIQKSQMGGGSPVLRGFEANKVLLVVDGVRLNNAIYRGGHLHNALSIDPAMLDRIEILYGSHALRYGSDALGGVLHFRSLDPIFSSDNQLSFSGKATLNLASANKGSITHAHAHISKSRWASLTSITYKNFGDLRAGSRRPSSYPDFGKRLSYVNTASGMDEVRENLNVNLQRNTGFKQMDLLHKSSFLFSESSILSFNLQHSLTGDVPRYDQLILSRDGEPTYAEWYYEPQQRSLLGLKWKWDARQPLFDKLIFQPSYQRIHEGRNSRLFDSEGRDHQDVKLDIYNITLDLVKTVGLLEIDYGVAFNTSRIYASAFQENIVTGEEVPSVITRFPTGDNSSMDSGIYTLLQYKLPHDLRLSLGGRYGLYLTSTQYRTGGDILWPDNYYNRNAIKNAAFTWSSGISKEWNSGLRLSGSISTAYRAPNLDDLAKMRIKIDEISIPNLDLKPVNTLNYEIGLSYTGKPIHISGHLYYTDISDIIVRAPAAFPDGRDYLLQGMDTLKTVANVNAASGNIFGGSLKTTLSLLDHWTADMVVTYTRGMLDNGAPLAHIPPLYGMVGINYKRDRWKADAYTIFNGKKKISDYGGSADNPEYATPEGTLAWWTLNMDAEYQVTEESKIQVGIENILDVHYRTFASGVSAPGINFKLGAEISF